MFTNIDRDIMHIILAAIIWMFVAACAVSSIFSQPQLTRAQRRFWLIIIIGLPIFGILAYIPFSLDNPKALRELINKMFPGKQA